MMHALKLRQIGSSTGVIVPKEVLTRMNVRKGDNIYLVQGQEGYRVVANDPGFDRVMEAYRVIAHAYRNAFRRLAQ